MKNTLFTTAIALGIAVLGAGKAEAGIVTYNTSASQLCIGAAGCGVLSQVIGGTVNVGFAPVGSSSVNATPVTFGSFGEIIVSCVGGGTACGSQSLSGLNLYINISQSVPSAGNASITGGVIAGSISGTASSATITWAVPNTVAIGNVRYSVANNPLALVPPSVNLGVTSVQAQITDVPEPATLWSMAIGTLLCGVYARRRKA